MRDAGGPSGLPYPPGDPAQVRTTARQLSRAAAALADASTGARRAAGAGTDRWTGTAATTFAGRTATVAGGVGSVSAATGRAGAALDRYADALEDAQRRARDAQRALADAAAERGQALRAAAAQGQVRVEGLARDAAERAQREASRARAAAEERAREAWAEAQRDAQRAADQAVDDACRAAEAAGRVLHGVVTEVRSATNADVLGWIGGPDAAIGLVGLFGQGITATRFLQMQKAIAASDLGALRARNPAGWAAVQRAVAQHGADSLEALGAKLRFEATTVTALMDDMSAAALPRGPVAAGGAARALDVLGRIGLVTAVASDLLILTDDGAGGLDKGMAAANLTGLALVAGGGTAATMLGLTAAAAWIPVVGQVLVAGTTVYFVGTFVAGNWDSITGGVGDAVSWTGQQLQDFATGVRRELAQARESVVDLADAAERRVGELADVAGERVGDAVAEAEERAGVLADRVGETADGLADDAGELVGGAKERAGDLVSSVNPFD